MSSRTKRRATVGRYAAVFGLLRALATRCNGERLHEAIQLDRWLDYLAGTSRHESRLDNDAHHAGQGWRSRGVRTWPGETLGREHRRGRGGAHEVPLAGPLQQFS